MRKLFLGFLLITGGSAVADDRLSIGVDVGYFFPTNSTVKDTFGNSWFRFGITPLSFQRDESWKFTTDIAYMESRRITGRARLFPITFGVTRGFNSDSEVRPYVALRAGPYFGSAFSPLIGVDKNNHIGLDINAALGVTFNDRFYVEIRYDWLSKMAGLDFNGWFFSAGVRLFDIKM